MPAILEEESGTRRTRDVTGTTPRTCPAVSGPLAESAWPGAGRLAAQSGESQEGGQSHTPGFLEQLTGVEKGQDEPRGPGEQISRARAHGGSPARIWFLAAPSPRQPSKAPEPAGQTRQT